jgi:hypothetical protein
MKGMVSPRGAGRVGESGANVPILPDDQEERHVDR